MQLIFKYMFVNKVQRIDYNFFTEFGSFTLCNGSKRYPVVKISQFFIFYQYYYNYKYLSREAKSLFIYIYIYIYIHKKTILVRLIK